jgi:hypothetical protein
LLILLSFGLATSLAAFVPPFAAGQFLVFAIQARTPQEILILDLLITSSLRPARRSPFAAQGHAGSQERIMRCMCALVCSAAWVLWASPFGVQDCVCVRAQGPNTAVVLWSVPARLRPFAMSVQVIVIHVLGDVPSPVALGWLQERLQNWRCATAHSFPMQISLQAKVLHAACKVRLQLKAAEPLACRWSFAQMWGKELHRAQQRCTQGLGLAWCAG